MTNNGQTPGGNTTTAGAVEQLAIELQPCPFCGHPAVIDDISTTYRRGVNPLWSVGCDNQHCGVEAHAQIVAPDATKAITAWNTRRQAHSLPGDVGMEACDFIESLIDQMDYVGTGSGKAAAAEEKEDRATLARLRAALTPSPCPGDVGTGKFAIGDRVSKKSGANWNGRVVGFYSTALTPIGYAVESEREIGSVQIYPEAALTPSAVSGDAGEGE